MGTTTTGVHLIDRGFIGHTTEATTVAVDGWRVKLFCEAIGETDPVHTDPDAARAAGHPACPLPPTFLKAIEGEHVSSARLLGVLGVPLRGVLHAEQAFDHLAPVHVGDVVEVSRRVIDIQDKKNGALTFIVIDTLFRVRSASVARSRQTIVVRNALSAA